jgi:hypothetical protein
MRACFKIVVFALLGLAGCGYPGPSLQGQPGLQYDVISFYNGRAMERSATCPNPEMQSITSSRIVSDDGKVVSMDVRYYWVDWSQAADVGGNSVTTCRDWSERTFTLARGSNGKLEVVGMSGGQKPG